MPPREKAAPRLSPWYFTMALMLPDRLTRGEGRGRNHRLEPRQRGHKSQRSHYRRRWALATISLAASQYGLGEEAPHAG